MAFWRAKHPFFYAWHLLSVWLHLHWAAVHCRCNITVHDVVLFYPEFPAVVERYFCSNYEWCYLRQNFSVVSVHVEMCKFISGCERLFWMLEKSLIYQDKVTQCVKLESIECVFVWLIAMVPLHWQDSHLSWNCEDVLTCPQSSWNKLIYHPYLILPYLWGWGHNRIGPMCIPEITARLLEPLWGSNEPHESMWLNTAKFI